MKQVARLGFALLLAAATLIPVSSEAALCSFQQCFANAPDCSQYVCPPGQVPVPRCNTQYCYSYCFCR